MFKAWQLRAIREARGWSQGQLAKQAGLTQPTISGLERGEIADPNSKTISAIVNAFEADGFFFTPNGIEHRTTNTYTIEGTNCYLQLLKEIEATLNKGDEVLKSGADERKSSPEVIAQNQLLRDMGIKTRSLIKLNDTHIMGNLSEYRWMDENLYVKGDVKVMFGNKVSYLVTWTDIPRIIVIEDKVISEEARRTFEYIWRQSKIPDTSTAPNKFNGVK